MRAISTLFLILSTLLTLAFGGWLYVKLEREASLPEGFFGVWAGGYTIVGAALLLFILGVVLRVVSRPKAAPGLPQALSTPPGSIPEADLPAPPMPPLGSSAAPEPWEAPAPPLPSPTPQEPAEEPEPWEPMSAPVAAAPVVAAAPPAPEPPPEPAPAVVESLATSGGEAFRVVESKPAVRSREPEPTPPPKPEPPAPSRPVMTSSPLPSLPAGKSFVQDLATADVETTAAFHAAPELAEVLASLTSDEDDPIPSASASAPSQPSGAGLPFEAGDVDELFAGLGEGLQEAFPSSSSPSSSSRSAARATNPSVPALSLGGQDLQARLQSLKNQVSAPRTTALPDGQVGKAPPARNKFDIPTRRVPGQEMVSPDLLTSGSAQLAKPAPTATSPSSTPLFMRSVQDIMGNDSGLPTDPFDKEIGGMPPAEANALWREYVEANRRCNRDLSRLKHEVFQDHLERNYAAICKRFECKSVSFSVKIKEGRVSLQATPVK